MGSKERDCYVCMFKTEGKSSLQCLRVHSKLM
jgi:hypothetical protein